MSLVGTSLNAATATGPGSAVVFDKPKIDVSMQVFTTGNPSSVTVGFDVSLDGVNFANQGSIGPGAIVDSIQSMSALGFKGPVVAVRANLTALTGGTSPTVTAIVAALDE